MNKAGVYQVVSDEAHGYTAFPARNYNNVGLAVGQTIYNDGALAGGVALIGSNNIPNDNASTYSWGYYIIVSDDNYEVNKTVTTYDINDTTKYVKSSVGYYYDDTTHQQIASTAHVDSRGNTRTTGYTYPYNYASGNATIDTMVSHNMFAEAIEKTDSYTTTAGTTVTGAQLNRFKAGSFTGTVVPYTVSTLRVAQPLTNFVPSAVASGILTADTRYQQMISFDHYDSHNNLTQYTTRNATPTGILWDYSNDLPIAQIKNAAGTALYTSFEADGKGGWVFSGTPVTDPTAPTGSLVYPLSAGSITSPTLTSGMAYVLSCWSKGGPATVTPYGGSPITGTLLNTNNAWSYYEYQVPAGTTTVTVSSSSGAIIDELRLYPAAGQMITYAYDPSGLRSISDTKGANSYFDYDFAQRLKNVKDWQGNIVKNFGYHTYDQVVGNQTQTGKFTSTTCSGTTISDTLIYTVQANKYYAATQAAANADAMYDMNTNGQSKANTNCACLVPFVLTNNLSPGVAHIPVTFTGTQTYNVEFPATGSKTFGFPAGTYTVEIFPTGSFPNRKFTLGSRAPVTAPGTTFTGVSITLTSNESTLNRIQPMKNLTNKKSLPHRAALSASFSKSGGHVRFASRGKGGRGLANYPGNTLSMLLLLLLLLSTKASAQTQTSNYIITQIPRVSGIKTDSALSANSGNKGILQIAIQYVDGLGRPIQTVQKQASPKGYDMILPQAYDVYGREVTKYLPYTPEIGTAGSFRPNAVSTDQNAFYSGPPTGSNVTAITDPFAQTNFDNSPMNRTVEQGAPGVPWQLSTSGITGSGHTVKMIYTENNSTSFASDSINGKQAALYYTTLNSDFSQTLHAGGYYTAGELTVTVMQDENWVSGRAGTMEVYKDIDGHVVLKRQYNYTAGAVQMLSTYYVYDDIGRLAFVLPPATGADADGTMTTATLNNLCYQYQYDERGRPEAKRLPGKGWEYTVYNIMDQPVATQDSLQGIAKQWIFTKYDVMGRVVISGIWNNGGTAITRSALQTILNGITTNLYESPTTTGNGYTNVAWPTSNVTTTLSNNYYDGYKAQGMPSAFKAPTNANLATRGELTATQTNVLGSSNMLWTAHYYDYWGRSLEGYAQHYLNGTLNANNFDAITSTYNFTNAPTTVTRKHWTSASTSYPLVTVYNKYIYDWVGRKQKTWEQLTNGNSTPDTMRLITKVNL